MQKGLDGGFLGNTNDFVVLDPSGKTLYLNIQTTTTNVPLKNKLSRVFTSPNGIAHLLCLLDLDADTILYFNTELWALGFASVADNYQFDSKALFRLRYNETPLQVQYCTDTKAADDYIGVLTSQRVVILSKNLGVLSVVEAPRNKVYYFHSCLWLGNALLYNTATGVYALYPDPSVETFHVCTLEYPNSVLCAVLCDRIIFACQKKKKVEVVSRYLSVVELLINGISAIPHEKASYEKRLGLLKSVTER